MAKNTTKEKETAATKPPEPPTHRELVISICDALMEEGRRQDVLYKKVQAVAMSDSDDGSHEYNALVRAGGRKAKLAAALGALFPLPTGPDGESIGQVEPLPGTRQ